MLTDEAKEIVRIAIRRLVQDVHKRFQDIPREVRFADIHYYACETMIRQIEFKIDTDPDLTQREKENLREDALRFLHLAIEEMRRDLRD